MYKTMATFLKRQTIWTFNHNRNILTTMTSLHYDDYDGCCNKSNRNNNHHRRFNKNNTFCCRTASTTFVRYTSSSTYNSNKVQQKFIYTSQKGDTAGHMVGSSVEERIRKNDEHEIIKRFDSFKNQWIEETGQSWPSECSTKGCCNEPTEGAHIFINNKEYAYLAPMCHKCNLDGKNYVPNEMIDNHLRFPIQLDNETPCVELTHLHISGQNKFANYVSPTWLELKERFIEYIRKHNSPLVPHRYKNDPQLGLWVKSQRRRYKKDGLHPGQIELLESNGFVWDAFEYGWDENIKVLIQYKHREGHCNVPYFHEEDGKKLGKWLSRQRHFKKKGTLDTEKEIKLNELGIVWDVLEYEWDENIKLLIQYKYKEGHYNVPYRHEVDGANLGAWFSRQRYYKKRGTLDTVKEKKLEELGIVWNVLEHEWEEYITLLTEYKDREGNCNVPFNHKEDGTNLGFWLGNQRQDKKRGTLDTGKEKQLEEIGIVWDAWEYGWDENIIFLIRYKDREGHCNVPYSHKEDGRNLGKWFSRQREYKRKGTLDTVKEKQLEKLDMVWERREYEFGENIKLLIKYKVREGHCNIPYNHKEDGRNLGKWLGKQRHDKKIGMLDAMKEKQLEELGIVWNVLEHEWEENVQLLIRYKGREGHCNVPYNHKEGGANLGTWYSRQKHGKLSEVRQERLREISVIRDDGTE